MIDFLLSVVRGVNRVFVSLACLLTVVIVVVVIASITARGMGAPIVWADDIAQIALLYLFFLALAPALESGHHVTVELFDPLVPNSVQRYLGVFSALAIAFFAAVFLMQLWKITGRSFATGRLATTVLPIPLQWLQIAGPIGVLQLLLTALAIAITELRTLIGKAATDGTSEI